MPMPAGPAATAVAPDDEAGDMPTAPDALLLGGNGGGAPLVRLFVDEPCDEALIPVD